MMADLAEIIMQIAGGTPENTGVSFQQAVALGSWLAEHDRQVCAAAWDEGWDCCSDWVCDPFEVPVPELKVKENPYRQGDE
jgi:hypothetical protein